MKTILRFGVASAAMAFLALPAWGDVQPAGREIRVSRQVDFQQINPVAAFAASGSSAVVWENDQRGLRAFFYGPNGRATGPEVTLVANRSLPGIPASGETLSRREPAAAFLPTGDLAVAWTEEKAFVRIEQFHEERRVLDSEIGFQLFSAAGKAIGNPVTLNATAAGFQQQPRIALLGGRVLVVWQTVEGGLSGRLVNAAGRPVGGEIAIAEAGATRPALAVSGNRALVTWEAADGSSTGIFAQLLNAAGNLVGSSFRINADTADIQRRSAIAAAPGGAFLVLFQSRTTLPGTDAERIHGQLVGAAGNLAGPQFLLETGEASGEVQMAPAVAPAPGGRFVVTWLSWPNHQAGLKIAGREIDAAGQTFGDVFWLTEQRIQRNFRRTSIATDGDGNYLAPWETIFRRRNQVIGARRLVAD
jgi:hypothetical protein